MEIKNVPLTQARYWFDWSSELQSVSVAFIFNLLSFVLPKLSFGPDSEPSVHSVGFISIHFHFFEQFGMWTKHTHRDKV